VKAAVVSAVAACTPVGLYAEASCAALRAGLSNMMELSTYAVDGEHGDPEPMMGARVPSEWLAGEPPEERWPGHERFGLRPPPPRTGRVPPGVERVLELCRIALGEIRERAALDEVKPDRYRVHVALNEDEQAAAVADELRGALGGAAERFVIETGGRAAGLALLERAMSDLDARRVDGVLLGGVDSLIRRPIAERLDRARRLRSFTAPQGLTPGEAAAFVYLESPAQAARGGRKALARVTAATTALEPSAGRDEPNRATGLAQALSAARAQAGLAEMPLVVCDLNGERPRAIEWALAATRALGDLHGDFELWHPADCVGDAGAALGVLDILWSAVAIDRGYAPRRRALVWGASDGGLRGAAVLDASTE
jgi:3-oxoacyl-[acyl-carrier-protein] synthase-1